jgi:hypothetical protein
MADSGQLRDHEAAQRRRGWLDGRRRWNRDLAVVLLQYAPEAEVARALDLLPAGELHHLAAALAHITDLHQVARRIAADLSTRGAFPVGAATASAPAALRRGDARGGGPSPRRTGHMDRPRARGAARA